VRAQAPAVELEDDFPFGANATPERPLSELDEQFAEFHLANPHVYGKLVALAREAKGKGKKPGIKMLFEIARWFFWMGTIGGEGFSLNNNFHSRYARLIMRQERDLEGFFNLRELRT
jgi:hypothetical protein